MALVTMLVVFILLLHVSSFYTVTASAMSL